MSSFEVTQRSRERNGISRKMSSALVNCPQRAFEKLLRSNQSYGNKENVVDSQSQPPKAWNHLPPCLRNIFGVQAKTIPCLICGKLFNSGPAILQHSNVHLSEYRVSLLITDVHEMQQYGEAISFNENSVARSVKVKKDLANVLT